MSKMDLKFAQLTYDDFLTRALANERAGDYAKALQYAVAAFEHVDGMMKYEQKYEDRSFKSVGCIDLVLRIAPFVLDGESLDRLGELLKSKKSIDRAASDDLAARLSKARDELARTYRLWNLLETSPGVHRRTLTASLGESLSAWEPILARLQSLNLARVTPEACLELVTDLDEPVFAKCYACGAKSSGAKAAFLSEQQCPGCGVTGSFCIVARQVRP